MRNKYTFLCLALLVVSMGTVFAAGAVQSIQGTSVPAIIADWNDLEKLQAVKPLNTQSQPVLRRWMKGPGPRDIKTSLTLKPGPLPGVTSIPEVTPTNTKSPLSIPPPTLLASFQGLGDPNTSIPPDTMGAVGPSHLMITLNTQVRIQTKTGGTVSTVDLDTFWSPIASGGGAFDPKVFFDEDIGRWIFVSCVSAQSIHSSVLLAVSSTSNPLQSWYYRAIPADVSAVDWADYPNLGFNKKWIAITMNMFSVAADNWDGTKLWVLDKYAAATPNTAPTYIFNTGFDTSDGLNGFTLVPAVTFGNQTDLFIVDSDWYSASTNNVVRVSKITGPVNSPVWTFVDYPDVQDYNKNYFSLLDAAQLGTSNTIATNDVRIINAVFRNGSIWYAQAGVYPVSGTGDRVVSLWHQVSTSMQVIQQGRIDSGSSTYFYFPSIAVAENNDVGFGFTGSSPSIYPSAMYTGRRAAYGSGLMLPVGTLKAGEYNYYKTYGGFENRWGDYSNTCIDPEDGKIWTIQEYAATPVTFGSYTSRWGVWWGKMDMGGTSVSGAPAFSNLPAVRLLKNNGLNPSLLLSQYNTGSQVTSYSITGNFAGLANLLPVNSETVIQFGYASATSGINVFYINNLTSFSYGTSKIKFSTYIIHKIPKIGITLGQSLDLNVAQYVINDGSGSSVPPNFGNTGSLSVSDPTKLSVTWTGNTVLHITPLSKYTGAVYVYLAASPNASQPYGKDVDYDWFEVHCNLLNNGAFVSASDTTAFAFQLPADRTVLPTRSYLASQADSAGKVANGVVSLALSSSSSGVKITPIPANHFSYLADNWYIARMRVFSPNAGNNIQTLLYHYNGVVPGSAHVDLTANVLFGTPTVWTWIEAPLYSHETGPGYPQILIKAGTGSGTVYIDEVQLIKTAPTLIDAKRYNNRLFYPYSGFPTLTNLAMGWSTTEIYGGAASKATPSVVGGALYLDFSGASAGASAKGIKLTANNNSTGTVYTPASTPGKEIGIMAYVTKYSGAFNTYDDIFVLSAYGVPVNGQFSFVTPPGQLFASGEFGRINNGWHYVVGAGRNAYHQFQFSSKSGATGLLQVDNVDFLRDQDDPNYGDGSLFP